MQMCSQEPWILTGQILTHQSPALVQEESGLDKLVIAFGLRTQTVHLVVYGALGF